MGELIGAMAGSFRIVARLGAGGMGEVYEGVHPTLGERVAIKVLHATAAAEPAAHGRFFVEVQAVVRIQHDGVVKVFDMGRFEDGRPYLAMELLDGQSLHEMNKQSRLPVNDACRIVIDVLDALAAAHAVGVVHRDVKPPNIFRTRSGRTVVVDFGIAKLLAPDTSHPLTTADTVTPHEPGTTQPLTKAGTAIGTPYYMAPEQIRGLPVTPAVDIYAAGVVLFELLCRRRPFDGAEDDILLGHLERRPPPPRALEPSIPLPVQDVILTALAKDPEQRHASAAVMRDALRAAIEDGATAGTAPVPSPPTSEPMPHTAGPETAAGPTVRDSPAARAPRLPPPAAIATVAAPDNGPRERSSSAPYPLARSHRARWIVAGAAVVAASVGAVARVRCSPSATTHAEQAKALSPAELFAALHRVASWNEIDADTRAVIQRVASGATNRLSTKARRYLLQVVDGNLSPELQGMMLRDVLTAGAATIAVVDEALTVPATKFVLEGPLVEQSYGFRGKVADAERWSARFADGTVVPVIAATTVQAGARMYSVREAVEAAAYLPMSARSRVRALVLNPVADPDDAYWAEAFHDKNMSAHLTADASGELTIYPMPEGSRLANALSLAGQMLHETGHIWSQQEWGIDHTKGSWGDWQRAIDADRIAVSRYARRSIEEDLAETVQIYAGLVGSPRREEYRALVPHRFAILDKSYPQP